jgi:hypothetical protein
MAQDMYSLPIIISTLCVIPFLFPRDFVSFARRIRYHLRNDLRKRLSNEEWNAIKHEFDDL